MAFASVGHHRFARLRNSYSGLAPRLPKTEARNRAFVSCVGEFGLAAAVCARGCSATTCWRGSPRDCAAHRLARPHFREHFERGRARHRRRCRLACDLCNRLIELAASSAQLGNGLQVFQPRGFGAHAARFCGEGAFVSPSAAVPMPRRA